MNYPEGSISEIELSNIYGKEILKFSKPFSREGHIISPFAYQALMELSLWCMARNDDSEKYEKWFSIYTDDYSKRFEKMKDEITKFIYREGLANVLAVPYLTKHSITNVYKKYFKSTEIGKKFIAEKEFEKILYDSFYYFDLGETLTVKRQTSTKSGPVDLMLKHDNDVYLIELKKGKAKRKDVYQSLDYVKGYDLLSNEIVHPILIAHEFDETIIKLARESGVACYRYFIGLDIPDTLIVLEGTVQNKSFTDFYNYMVHQTGEIVSVLPDFEMTLIDKASEVSEKLYRTMEWIKYCLEKYEKGA